MRVCACRAEWLKPVGLLCGAGCAVSSVDHTQARHDNVLAFCWCYVWGAVCVWGVISKPQILTKFLEKLSLFLDI